MLLCFIIYMQLSMVLCPPIPETKEMPSQLDGVVEDTIYIYPNDKRSFYIFYMILSFVHLHVISSQLFVFRGRLVAVIGRIIILVVAPRQRHAPEKTSKQGNGTKYDNRRHDNGGGSFSFHFMTSYRASSSSS